MRNFGLEETQAGIKIAGRNISNLRYADDTTLMADFIFLGSKITADGNCSHAIKTLGPWKKSYDKPRQYIKKQRHHFAEKGLYSHVVMYKCESWTVKKAECQRIDAFELWR